MKAPFIGNLDSEPGNVHDSFRYVLFDLHWANEGMGNTARWDKLVYVPNVSRYVHHFKDLWEIRTPSRGFLQDLASGVFVHLTPFLRPRDHLKAVDIRLNGVQDFLLSHASSFQLASAASHGVPVLYQPHLP